MGPRVPGRDAIDAPVQYMAFRLEILRLSYGFHTCASPNRCLESLLRRQGERPCSRTFRVTDEVFLQVFRVMILLSDPLA